MELWSGGRIGCGRRFRDAQEFLGFGAEAMEVFDQSDHIRRIISRGEICFAGELSPAVFLGFRV